MNTRFHLGGHCLAVVMLAVTGGFGLGINRLQAQSNSPHPANPSSVFGVFAGSSPCGEEIRGLLEIPAGAEAELMQWKLTLYQDPKTLAPASYQLHCDYGPVVQGKPGLGKRRTTVARRGPWTISKGTKSASDAVVFELDKAVSFLQVDRNILHVLGRDRSLLNGNSGWSYTLNRTAAAETPVEPGLAATVPDMSYQISAVATGPSVFGIFEGRSPCQGIARVLKVVEHAGCMKAKWRVTLYQNPDSSPTTYKVEGSLYRRGAREGSWSMIRGTETDANAIVYRLDPGKTEPPLFLLKGDDNVLFFLDQDRKPLVGHAEFSYTLNRRASDPPSKPGPAQK